MGDALPSFINDIIKVARKPYDAVVEYVSGGSKRSAVQKAQEKIPPRPVLSKYAEQLLASKDRDYSQAFKMRDLLADAGKKYGQDEFRMMAHSTQESNSNPLVKRGKSGEIGMMQVLPSLAKGLGFDVERMKKDPWYNAVVAAKYSSDNQKAFSDALRQVMAYNAGATKVRKHTEEPSHRDYARKVIARESILRQMDWDQKYGKKK